jgi:hypothetical protein
LGFPRISQLCLLLEGAYEQATREGYGENPKVIAALIKLKSAWRLLRIANCNLMMAKGFFTVELASMRFDRACQATREACIELHTAIVQAVTENRLYNRCLMVANADVA